ALRRRVRSNMPEIVGSALEVRFIRLWIALDGPRLVRERRFCPARKWRADFVHDPSNTMIEIEGGTFKGGRHVRGRGFQADCEKYNAAAVAGWTVFRLTGPMISAAHVQPIIDHIKRISRVETGPATHTIRFDKLIAWYAAREG